MNVDEFKEILKEAGDPVMIDREMDALDRVLLGVIKLEKKHLYGAETTSAGRRREEIEKFLDRELSMISMGD